MTGCGDETLSWTTMFLKAMYDHTNIHCINKYCLKKWKRVIKFLVYFVFTFNIPVLPLVSMYG